jgi:hypothetical protein
VSSGTQILRRENHDRRRNALGVRPHVVVVVVVIGDVIGDVDDTSATAMAMC